MKIKIVSRSGRIPEYKTKGAAAFDIAAYLDEPMLIKKGERCLVPTGIFMELPEGYEAQVRARSGLAIKNGIGLINGVGTIDSDYRGEILVPLINLGDDDFVVKDGDRIAQVVIAQYCKAQFVAVEELTDTDRGSGGFGHTGV